jgi:hypothetical protein
MKPWWSLRGEERAKAKAAYEATVSPLVRRGPRPNEITTSDDAITVRGVRYAFADHGGPVLAGMLAHAGCPPLGPDHQIEVTKRFVRVDSVKFERGVAATFTQITYENLKRARENQPPSEDGGPTVTT